MPMPKQMEHITPQMLKAIVNGDPRASFDTHWLEKRILRDYPVAFAKDLLRFKDDRDPLHRFSMAFSQWFGGQFPIHIKKTSNAKEKSENLAGDVIENQGWTKVSPGTPIP
jgi:hypothetical protein